jgi:CheY-like chemotaxis protein
VSTKPQRILVVDDEPVIRDMMVDILDLEGYVIEVARNGRDALERLLHAKSSEGYLIFLDLMMPVMDGYELCLSLNADTQLRARHTIVLMSALDQLSATNGLHADAIMPKPFVVEDVLHIIQQFMA